MTVVRERSIPKASQDFYANPFKLFIPRELEEEPARAIWSALRENSSIVLADPFAMPGLSTVFPGVVFDVSEDFTIRAVVHTLNDLAEKDEQAAAALEDSWVELWVPDSLDDQAEPLDVTDLSGR